jgi:hypothetical protein
MFSEIQLAQSALAAGTIQRQINDCCARTASNDCSFGQSDNGEDAQTAGTAVFGAPATDSSSRRPTFPAHFRISFAW